MGISIENAYANNHVRAEGIFSVRRKAMIDEVLVAFRVQRFILGDVRSVHAWQATALEKNNDGLANARQDLGITKCGCG